MKLRSQVRTGLIALFCALAVGACGGDSGSGGSSTSNQVGALPGHTTSTIVMTVVMPAGVDINPDQLQVITSVGNAVPDSAGSVTVGIYAGTTGSQLAIVLSPNGNPMLMGWVDATHTTLSAETTAEVLAYFALGGPTTLSTADSQTLIQDIPAASGLAAVTTAIQTQLAADPDAFAASNTALTNAVSTFATALYASVGAVTSMKHAVVHASQIQPAQQSGITVVEGDPFTAYLMNNYRRRAHAFVQRVSYTASGSTTQIADPASITQFDVPPVVGINGGVTGAITDFIASYYGVQPTAWGPITAPDPNFAVPLESGADTTTYQVTVVGPGAGVGASGGLPADQAAALTNVCIESFVLDFFVPTIANLAVGSGQREFEANEATGAAKLFVAVGASLTTDLTPYFMASLPIQDELKSGQWVNAARDLTAAVGGLNALQTLIVKSIEAANPSSQITGESGWLSIPYTSLFTAFNKYMSAAGGILQGIDSTAYLVDIAHSNQADQWTIVETNSVVKLNPAASTVDIGATVPMTATVLGTESQTGYSYNWTLSSSATGGTLTQIGGNSLTGLTQYCSSGNQTLWTYKPGETPGDVDTVTVQVYSGSNCANGTGTLLGTAKATVTYKPADAVTLSPATATLAASGTETVSATLANPVSASDGIVTYQWVVTGNAGGTLTNPATGAASTSYVSSSATSTYTASATAMSPQQDSVTVTAYLAPTANPSAQTTIGVSSPATITFGNPWLGNWVGNTVSTCGYYSGPQSFDITLVNSTTLDFGPYDATFSGNTAQVNGGEVVFTLSGNTMTGYEADSCQTGTYTRQ